MIGEAELTAAMMKLAEEGPVRGTSPRDWWNGEGVDPEAARHIGFVLTDVCLYEAAEEQKKHGRPLNDREMHKHVWETVMTALEVGWIARRDNAT